MKGFIFIYLMTAFGIVGGVFNPLIPLFVYIGFAMLRPQFLWGFAGNFAGISQYVAIAMLGGWVLKGFGQHSTMRVKALVWPLLFFSIWTFISAYGATNYVAANNWAIEFLKIAAPFLVGLTMMNSVRSVRGVLWTIVGTHAYIGYGMNMAYLLTGFNEVGEYGFGGVDNNSFATSLILAQGPAIVLTLTATRWWEKALGAASSGLILHTILLTYSRGGILGLVLTLATIFFLLPKKPSYMAAVLVVALVAFRFAGPELVARFSTTFAEGENRDASAQSRVDLWKACWAMAVDSPLVGVGPRNFPTLAGNYGFTRGKEAHSTWMQTLAEMGFVGLGALVVFYGSAIAYLLPLAKRKWTPESKERIVLAGGILASLLGFILSAQFVTMTGLETSYYLIMAGAILVSLPATAAATEPVLVAASVARRVAPAAAPRARPVARPAGAWPGSVARSGGVLPQRPR